MLSEQQIKNNMVCLIQELKDSFEKDDIQYLEVDEIKFEERSIWSRYDDTIIVLMARIRVYKKVLDIEDDDFIKIFNEVERRDSA